MGKTEKVSKDIDEEMPFLDHLEELRWRLIRIIVAIFLGAIAVYFVSNQALKLLVIPFNRVAGTKQLIFLEPTGGFMIHLQISFFGGLIAALPLIFYQLWKFIAPGLYEKERGWALLIIIISTFSFLVGAAFAYFIIIPLGLSFLLGFESEMLVANLTVTKYLSFILTLLFVTGLVFEMPLIAFALTKIGMLTPSFMRKNRRYGIVFILIGAALLTPPDVATQSLLAIPLLLLYEISIWVSQIALKRKSSDQTTDSESQIPQEKESQPEDSETQESPSDSIKNEEDSTQA
ncbi:twin-arginine translocase subunit TatC [bacterium]|nr:twin-arginine translocase subunit TatC [bacterium]